MPESGLQLRFIQKIKEIIPANLSLVDELADLLEISNDSVYRRIRGETPLTIEEISKLCSHYRISFDSLNNNTSGTVTFTYKNLYQDEENYTGYFHKMLQDLKQIAAVPNGQIVFAAEDVPVFRHFSFPDLAAFKLFYWQKSILNYSSFESRKFEIAETRQDLLDITKEIVETYNKINSSEIWTEDTITSTLKQIEFYWDSGLFAREDEALRVTGQVMDLINLLERQAESGSKNGDDGNFKFYACEVTVGNNSILVCVGNMKFSYLSLNTFNSMVTSNATFCEETDLWLKNLVKKSVLISGVSEKQRLQFFRKLRQKVENLVRKIEG